MNTQETRKLASFRTVDEILPIENADAIEVAVIGGWKVVVKKNEFEAGEMCVYFEIDSFLPEGVPAWQFLVDKSSRTFNGVVGHKLRTIRLRGTTSQGLILKPSQFPVLDLVLKNELTDEDDLMLSVSDPALGAEVKNLRGLDSEPLDPFSLNLNNILGIVKWEPVLPAEMQGQAQGLFPSFIPKTDQERAQNISPEIFGFEERLVPFDFASVMDSEALHELEAKGDVRAVESNGEYPVFMKVLKAKGDPSASYEVTLKLDGSSMTVFARCRPGGAQVGDDGEMLGEVESGVCSRNLQLKVNEANSENTFVKTAVNSRLLSQLEFLCEEFGLEYAIQGELMGPGIQGNRENLSTHEFFVYDIIDIAERRKLTPDERIAVYDCLIQLGANIKHVPVIAQNANLFDTLGFANMDSLLKFAVRPSISHAVAEGVVFKRRKGSPEMQHLDGEFSFKVISNKFLEKEKE